jgi:benzoyl-CoA reductase/2-hydroxyglutaryl-CoA dehydratase subunit BcrC/BadD/HgdB
MPETNGIASNNIPDSLNTMLTQAPQKLLEAKNSGIKVVGYFCPYIPEELILAGGMLPLRLAFGGEQSAAGAGDEFLGPDSCPFARACLGYRLETKNEFYQLIDALCVAQTCENMKAVGEYWRKYLGIPVFTLGLTHTHDALRSKPQALEYFREELQLLRQQLSRFSGIPISDRNLRKAVQLCNSIRENLRTLFDYPRSTSSPISWYEVLHIAQAGFVINRQEYLAELKQIVRQMSAKRPGPPTDKRVRLMLSGSVIAAGDDVILNLVNKAGGNIVADAVCTGSAFARKSVTIFGISGSPVEALAERYLYNIPCACMTDLDKRLNRITRIAGEYRVSGLIYYSLKYCDTWRSEFPLIRNHLNKEAGIPSLLLEPDYSSSDTGIIQTKIEAFIEMVRGHDETG